MNRNVHAKVIYVRRLKAGSVARIVFIGAGAALIPLCMLFGVMALFGAGTVQLNGAPVVGIAGFLLSLVYGPLFAGFLGLFAWVATYSGLRIVGRFKPFAIEYIESLQTTRPGATDNPDDTQRLREDR